MKLFDTPITKCFVAPIYCQQLVQSGLYETTLYQWKIYGGYAQLVTKLFDNDHYYTDGQKKLDEINPPDLTLPAYTIKDVEDILPKDYLIMFTSASEYIIAPSSLYPVEGCTAARMPDAFAMLLLEYIRKRCVDITTLKLIPAK